ncbi:hypothetical protein GCM10009625_31410 [Brachybacterium fresconis]
MCPKVPSARTAPSVSRIIVLFPEPSVIRDRVSRLASPVSGSSIRKRPAEAGRFRGSGANRPSPTAGILPRRVEPCGTMDSYPRAVREQEPAQGRHLLV